MDHDKDVRSHVLSLLRGGNAHLTIEEAVKDFPEDAINRKFPNGKYSSWGLLEHIRRAQWDILDFIRNSNYKQKDWPDDYWPDPKKNATKASWSKTLKQIKADSKELEKILSDPNTDLYAKIPHAEGQTILREMLLVADHNSYHLGEFAIMRQVMGTWGKNHKG